MLSWWKNIKKQAEEERLKKERIDDSIKNGAKTTNDVMIGRLPFPEFSIAEAKFLRKSNYQEVAAKIEKVTRDYRPFPHRNYSESEVIVITEDLINIYWLSEIREEVLSEFNDADYGNENALESFIERCFALASSKGFVLGVYDLNPEQHKEHLTRKWTHAFMEALISRMEKRIKSL